MHLFLLLTMIFCHIVDDYYLQGILASLKQKSWWKKNAPDKLYEHDYIMALVMHAFSWSFMIMLPVAVILHFEVSTGYLVLFVVNWVAHAIVDDMKANKKCIDLITDQCFHMMQIVCTWMAFV